MGVVISGPDDVDRDFGSSSSNLRFATAGGTTTKTYNYPGGNNKLSSITQGATTHRSFSYDGASNISADTRGATAYNYHYNNRNRLDELTIGSTVTADYIYDGLERLAIRTTQNMTPAGTTHYVYDLAGHLIAESTDTGTTTREYVWLDDMPIAVVADVDTPTPNLYYVHADHLDRPLKMTDGTEAVVWDAVYNPFGDVNAITGSASNNLRFPGQYFLIESGLHYNWYRHYDPTIGRYAQTDPLEFVDGPSIYAYAKLSPDMYIDSRGLMCDPNRGCWTTPDESRAAHSGDYTGYYNLACSNGDAYACFAGDVASGNGFWGGFAEAWLRMWIDLSGAKGQCELDQIKRDLAQMYADYLSQSEEGARWPKAQDIAKLHWDEFAKFGGPPNAFLGTPFGKAIGTILPGIWCRNCR